MGINKTIYKLGVKYTNPFLASQVKELLKSDFYALDYNHFRLHSEVAYKEMLYFF